MLKVSDYDYHLPEALIAQEPLAQRDHSKLMILHRSNGAIEHKHFYDIIDYLQEGDLLVFNNTKVIPARLFGKKEGTGARIEVLLLKRQSINQWEALVKPGKKLPEGTNIIFGEGELEGRVVEKTPDGGRIIEFKHQGIFEDVIDKLGQMPLPPYITKLLEDRERYQTVYAREQGAAAAPTAGLHFTNNLIDRLRSRGIETAFVTLHVGLGTFRPVKVENILEHQMHAEYFTLSNQTAEMINETRKKGKHVFAVGTTTVRVLETLADENGLVSSQDGWTDIFIYPGYKFRCVDALITNFHLPKSTLLMLISAFAGKEKITDAYNTAIENDYRFFSFGDAMLIL